MLTESKQLFSSDSNVNSLPDLDFPNATFSYKINEEGYFTHTHTHLKKKEPIRFLVVPLACF